MHRLGPTAFSLPTSTTTSGPTSSSRDRRRAAAPAGRIRAVSRRHGQAKLPGFRSRHAGFRRMGRRRRHRWRSRRVLATRSKALPSCSPQQWDGTFGRAPLLPGPRARAGVSGGDFDGEGVPDAASSTQRGGRARLPESSRGDFRERPLPADFPRPPRCSGGSGRRRHLRYHRAHGRGCGDSAVSGRRRQRAGAGPRCRASRRLREA